MQIPRRGPKCLLSLKEEFTLTLLRLRRGFDTKSLGDMFGVSESSVCRIFTTWVCLMNIDFSFLIKWPTREQIRENSPKCFKYFKKTRCVIDCTEFFVQKPSLPSPPANNILILQTPQYLQVSSSHYSYRFFLFCIRFIYWKHFGQENSSRFWLFG